MAYQGEYNPSVPSQPDVQDSTVYESDHGSAASTNHVFYKQRARGDSSGPETWTQDTARLNQARRPINDAVTSAFQTSETNNALPPEVLSQITAQITANVIQQLRTAPLASPISAYSVPSASMDARSSGAGSPPMDRSKVYTPPSPYRPSESAGQIQPSPVWPPPGQPATDRLSPQSERRVPSPPSPASHVEEAELKDAISRPQGPKRLSTSGDATVLEKIWGTLFTEDGQSTLKMSQFLRGIAVHLIEDYEPKNSIVITPSKMQKYYTDTKVNNEIYPWHVVFDDRTSSISRLFREISVQHHLVQEKLDERPDLPGLTPQGFETWMTIMIRAHPDQEYERLAKTLFDMPISNPDDRKERFPKEITRRLFPTKSNAVVKTNLEKALSTHCNIPLTRGNSVSSEPEEKPPQTSYRSTGEPAQPAPVRPVNRPAETSDTIVTPVMKSGGPGRREKAYHKAPSEASIEEDGEDMPTPQPIERERKPYVAQPGGGKYHESLGKSDTAATDYKSSTTTTDYKASANAAEYKIPPTTTDYKTPSSTTDYKPSPRSDFRPIRSNSVSDKGRYMDGKPRPAPIAIHQKPPPAPPPPMDIPDARRARTNSTYHRDQQPREYRARSPSAGKGYNSRSEADPIYGSSYQSQGSIDLNNDDRRYRDFESGRERHANDKYDPARMSAYDPREREREPRSKAGTSFVDANGRAYYADEDYYRGPASAYPVTRDGYGQYPPTAYRDTR